MRARICVLVAVASCYSPHANPGAPCSPAMPSCPLGQTCELVQGQHVCVEGPVADGSVDSARVIDAPVTTIDAPLIDAAPRRWTLVQSRGASAATLSIVTTGAGHLIVVGIETSSSGAVTSVTDSASNTYMPIARAVDTTAGNAIELWYTENSQPGATTITASAPTVSSMVNWEVAGILTTGSLDTSAKLEDQAATTTPLGASLTTNVAGEFVVSVAVVQHLVAGIHSGNEFTNDHLTFANGWAHLTDPAAPAGSHQAEWDQPTAGAYCSVSAAFLVAP